MIINELAKLSNISIRTLQYYDEIGLLKPSRKNHSGYRIYDNESIKKLQQILFYKELNFSLSQIKTIINDKNFDKEKALNAQRKLLEKKRDRLENLLSLIDSVIKGENNMSFKEFNMDEINKAKKEYTKEVEEKWGNTKAYKQSKRHTDSYSKKQWETIKEESNNILEGFSKIINKESDCLEAQTLVQKWKDHINKYYYDCDNEMLNNLADMYISDSRFTKNMDKFKEGTTKFINKAIKAYIDKNNS